MKPITIQDVDGKNAKITVAATEVRIKLPKGWTPEERAGMTEFLTKVARATPDHPKTLRYGKLTPGHVNASSLTLHEGSPNSRLMGDRIQVTI